MTEQKVIGSLKELLVSPDGCLPTIKIPRLDDPKFDWGHLADGFAQLENLGLWVRGIVFPTNQSPVVNQNKAGIFYHREDMFEVPDKVLEDDEPSSWYAWGARVIFSDAVPPGHIYVLGCPSDEAKEFVKVQSLELIVN
jgi:hypothetical protein